MSNLIQESAMHLEVRCLFRKDTEPTFQTSSTVYSSTVGISMSRGDGSCVGVLCDRKGYRWVVMFGIRESFVLGPKSHNRQNPRYRQKS